MPDPVSETPLPGLLPAGRSFVRMNAGQLSRVVGVPWLGMVEPASADERVDHVWISIAVPGYGNVQLNLSTRSSRNRRAGFDDAIRLAVLRESGLPRPKPGVHACPRFDYADIERQEPLEYVRQTRDGMERILLDAAASSDLIEAWGSLYARDHVGLHEIHSRKASCAVPQDLRGRDGAVRFYRAGTTDSELFLLKFCGQL